MVKPSISSHKPVVLAVLASQLNGVHPVAVSGIIVAIEAALHIACKRRTVLIGITISSCYLTDRT